MISVVVNGLKEVRAKILDTQKQVKFANMKAVNRLAKEVQDEEVNRVLPGAFTLRSKGAPWQKPGSRFGVNIRPFATRDNPVAVVGSQADWLRLQEDGGIKKAAGHRLAIATPLWRDYQQVIRAAQKPKRILKAKKVRGGVGVTFTGGAFVVKLKSGKEGIFARTDQFTAGAGLGGGKHGPTRRQSIRPLFFFFDHATVKKKLFFFEKGQAFVQKRYKNVFDEELAKAIATAK